MKPIASHESFSEFLIPGTHAIIAHNPDEEIGFVGKKNTELRPDIRYYDCRAVLTTTVHPTRDQFVVIPLDCEERVKRTLHYLRDKLQIPGLLPDESIRGIPFEPNDTMVRAVIKRSRAELKDVFQRVDCLSYTMYTPEVRALQDAFPQLSIPGNLRVSEELNNKALAALFCMRHGIRVPETVVVFSLPQLKESYRLMLGQYGFPLVVKGGRGAGGYAAQRIMNDDDFERALPIFLPYFQSGYSPAIGLTPDDIIGVVLQRYVEHVVGSPGAVAVVRGYGKDSVLLGVTEQILNENDEHVGNTYPLGPYYTRSVAREIHAMMARAAHGVRLCGVRDVVLSADFVVARESGSYIPYLVEFNMRASAQFGGLAMVHHLLGTTKPQDVRYFIGDIDLGQPIDTIDDVELFLATLSKKASFDRHSRTGFVPLNLAFHERVHGVLFGSDKIFDEVLKDRSTGLFDDVIL